jgi:hypothetical protein
LRKLNKELLDSTAYVFPIKDALMYVQKYRGGYGSGSNIYIAENPPFGATFTYYIKEAPKTLKDQRQEKEKDLFKDKKPIPMPTMDELRAEENEVLPHLVFTIKDESGSIVRKLTKGVSEGMSRINWNLRYSAVSPVRVEDKYDPMNMGDDGMFVLPGKYTITMAQVVRGEIKDLAGPVEFIVKPLNNTTLPAEDRAELVTFQRKLAELGRVVRGSEDFAYDVMERIRSDKQAAQRTPEAGKELMVKIEEVEKQMDNILWKFNGQQAKASQEENLPAPPSINDRLYSIIYTHYSSTAGITQTQRDGYDILKEEFPPILNELKSIFENELPSIEKELENIGAPWTPGRIPEWNIE